MRALSAETKRMWCAGFFLLLSIAAVGSTLLFTLTALRALGEERWLQAAVFAALVPAVILVGLWSWKRMLPYRPADHLPERMRCNLAKPRDPRQTFKTSLRQLCLVVAASAFLAGTLLNNNGAVLADLTAGQIALIALLMLLFAVSICLTARLHIRTLMKYAPPKGITALDTEEEQP